MSQQALKQHEQGSTNWHQWRLQGIGASEVPCLMGEADWSTPTQIWEVKTGRKPASKETNWAMQRGIDNEPRIRALYELEHDIEMPACLMQHPDLPFFRCSLDGFNADASLVLEIKYPSKEKHALAKQGLVPQCYRGQVQAQLFITGAALLHYVSFDGKDIAIVEVRPDLEYIARMVHVVTEFWKCVQNDTPPALTDDDFKVIKTREHVALCEEFKAAKLVFDQAEARLEEIRKRMQMVMPIDHNRILCAGVEVIRSERSGAIDYAKVPELQGINLEPYRKKPSKVFTIKVRGTK